MRWYLLRDRRHEGPYTKEQIAEGVKAGRIDPRDYLLPEIADEDQSSFAYISASDILGPEFLYDLKKNQEISPQGIGTASTANIAVSSEANKEHLISEFEDRVESTQLVNLKKERANSDSTSTQATLASFASRPESSFKFPWAIAGVLLLVVGLAAYFAQPIMNSIPSSIVASKPEVTPSSNTPSRSIKQNRIPTGRVQLPSTGARDEEPAMASPSSRPISEERAEPTKKRRKRKAVNAEGTEAGEDADAASDAESFDEEEYVEEDESSEEDVDESDI